MSILSSQKQSVSADFPNVRPSLDLRFALAKKLDPRITFTRGSSATYFGPDGLMRTAGVNEPRFDHDPVTGQSLGLLVEESRINSLLYSQDFSNASWIISGLSFSYNNVIGLDGTTTASTFTAISTNTLNAIYQNFTCTASTTYTFSFYVKLGTLPASSYKIAVYNNTALSFIATNVVPTQTLSSNSWTRVSYTFTTPVGCVSARVYPYRNDNRTQNNGTFYLWGAQLETGSFPTSYIPTSGSTVTRSPDNASMTGTNFSSWYNPNEGSFFIEDQTTYQSTTSNYNGVGIYSGYFGSTNSNRIVPLLRVPTNVRPSITISSIAYMNWNASSVISGRYKGIISYSSSGSSSVVNGSIFKSTRAVTFSTADNLSMYLGSSWVKRIIFYPIQLTNQQLINLTS